MEQEKCPKCGAQLDYTGNREFIGESVFIAFKCPKCGCEGDEVYDLTFNRFVLPEDEEQIRRYKEKGTH